ncbi:4-phosphoerythronate dehydrogenase [Balneolales bacterium ANBcel1]|nr:4-phosphoerythronate dehydrogenase [Balneolales bacterium ANBcel1]
MDDVITVLGDQNHYLLERYLHPSLKLETYDPIAGWTDDQIRRADALLVRTVNPVNANTIPTGHRLRFVGTASAGRDHLDESWLRGQGIATDDAKGSNARCVGEYVAVATLLYCDANGVDPETLTAGIVGAGFTGSAVSELLEAIGIRCLRHDPPRAERDPSFVSAPVADVLECDIISFHVPLETGGAHPTRYWFDEEKIRAHPRRLAINASRGGVVDEQALRRALTDGHIQACILDVWENEPRFNDSSLEAAFLATPHIAGYSIEAKAKASEMICRSLHKELGLPDPGPVTDTLYPASLPGGDASLSEILNALHPARSYDHGLRGLAGNPDAEKGPAFLRLRQNTPLRNEFRHIEIPESVTLRYPALAALGLRTLAPPRPNAERPK